MKEICLIAIKEKKAETKERKVSSVAARKMLKRLLLGIN